MIQQQVRSKQVEMSSACRRLLQKMKAQIKQQHENTGGEGSCPTQSSDSSNYTNITKVQVLLYEYNRGGAYVSINHVQQPIHCCTRIIIS